MNNGQKMLIKYTKEIESLPQTLLIKSDFVT